MFRIAQIILPIILVLNSGFNRHGNEILRKTISKLSSLESIEYDYTNHWHYGFKNVDIVESRKCFYDFKSDEDSIGLRYYIQDEYGESIFNGDTLIEVSESTEMIFYSLDFNKEFVLNVQGMSNSLFALKKFLPMIIDNPSVHISQQKDTIIYEDEYYKFHIKFEGSFDLGGFGLGQTGSKIEQILVINKQNYMPQSYRTIYPKHIAGYQLATYENIKIDIIKPDSIWTMGRFPKEFTRITHKESFKQKERIESIYKKGEIAPDWTLAMIDGDSVKLSEQRGHTILIEFFYPQCRPCIMSVPEINKFQKTYKNKGLKVFGIEYFNTDEEKIKKHIKKYNIEFPVISGNKNLANEYGIKGAPTFFLIDKKGRFVYTRFGFNSKELDKAIRKNL